MTGRELRAIRLQLGETVRGFAKRLGYQGNENTNSVLIREYERGKIPIPPWVEAKALALTV